METIKTILTISVGAIPFIISTFTYLLKFTKNKKAQKFLSGAITLTEQLQPLIIKAESFTHYTGEEKKQYVMTLVNQYAIDNKLKFDAQQISNAIDELVATTKKVNITNNEESIEKSFFSTNSAMAVL